MKYTKGQSGNPKGRPKGSKNKVKAQVVDVLGGFLVNNAERIQNLFDELTDPKDKLKFIVSVLPYIVPRQQSEKPAEDGSNPDRCVEVIKFVVVDPKDKTDQVTP